MSASGVDVQAVVLPTGGGALRGLGESFEPDLQTGEGRAGVPIACPPGRNGFGPDLALRYSAKSGNGPFGVGWSLGLGEVARSTRHGVPTYDESDTFVYAGADLVEVPESPVADDGVHALKYRPRAESAFSLIVHRVGTGVDEWEVVGRDGISTVFGGEPDARIADDDGAGRVFAWLPSQRRDRFGNRIMFRYRRDRGRGADARPLAEEFDVERGHRYNQVYLSQLAYVEYGPAAEPRYLYSIDFDYGERDSTGAVASDWAYRVKDPFSSFRSGFEVRTARRCGQIFVRMHAETGTQIVRLYQLDYRAAASNNASLLERVTVLGDAAAGAAAESLPPLTFSYTEFQPQRQQVRKVTCREALPFASLTDSGVELADIDECGLPGFLRLGYGPPDKAPTWEGRETWQPVYYRNLGNGMLDGSRPHLAPKGITLSSAEWRMADVIGTSVAQLLRFSRDASRIYLSRPEGFSDGRPFVQPPQFDPEDQDVQLVDVDGDGVIDALRITENVVEVHRNDPKRGWKQLVMAPGPRPSGRLGDPDGPLKLADVSGDGPLDVVELTDGAIRYWHFEWDRGGGRVRFDGPVTFADSPQLGAKFDPQRMLFVDVDGDGYADLIYVGQGEIKVWLNQSGNRFAAPITIPGTPAELDLRAVRPVDFLGDGTAGLLWSLQRPGAGASFAFLDLTGGQKPYLLRSMDNARGAVVQVDYAPSTRFYLADVAAGQPWRTSLPFPVQVVTRITVDDVFSGSRRTSEYRYHHGCWDGAEREFRGFARTDQLDSCIFDTFTANRPADAAAVPKEHFSPPTEIRTWFHVGPVGRGDGSWSELDLREEYWYGDRPQLADKRTGDDLRVSSPSGGRVRREAVRGLHGQMLRSESYARDESPRADRPYAIVEYQYEVIPIRDGRPPGDPSWELAPVVSAREVGQRSTIWDGGDDPQTSILLTGGYDEFGQPCWHSSIAMPRRSLARRLVTGAVVGAVQPDETVILATHTRTTYATPPTGVFLYNRVAEVRTYELAAPPGVAEQNPADVAVVLTDQVTAASAIHAQFLTQDAKLIGHTVNYYDGKEPFAGLPKGQLGEFGALTRTRSLVATSAVLDTAYTVADQLRRPSYLGGPVRPPAGAPSSFGSDLGYIPSSAAPSDGYYADTLRRRYDFQQPELDKAHGLLTATRDPRGAQTDIEPDRYWLLPGRMTDVESGLTTKAKYDYRTQQPICLTDANGNQSFMTYTGLGLPAAGWASGKDGKGGSADHPDVTFSYDLLAYLRARNSKPPQLPQPISVCTCRRVWHASDPISEDTISTWEYSDGFGRLVQKRAQAAELAFGTIGDDTGLPAPPGMLPTAATGQHQPRRVVVSGRQVYDNKGRVVQAYEPFFALDGFYRWPGEEPQGHRVDTYYDPRGNVIRTLRPDGTQSRVIFGVPREPDGLTLTDTDLVGFPAGFTPSPWETYTYDANDLAGLSTDPDAGTRLDAEVPADHAFTPSHTVTDSLRRVRCQVTRKGPVPTDDWMITQSGYDIRGNLLTITDPLGRTALSHSYDLLNRRLGTSTIDGGTRTSVLDAAGNPVEDRTSAGSITLRRYDRLNRLVEVWACDSGDQQVTLRERLTYGDQGTATQDPAEREDNRDRNRLGRLAVHDDEAGTVELDRYDFKGNLLRKTRRVISDTALETGWTPDWADSDPRRALDPVGQVTDTAYDALNRPVRITYPDTGTGRPVIETVYDRTGAIERISLDGTPQITQIAYNAKGQTVLVGYGNATFTRYTYDPRNFRLLRQRSERCTAVGDTWAGHGNPLQDFTYLYDPVGNITRIEERVPGCGIRSTPQPPDQPDPVLRHLLAAGDALVRTFTYDPLYRLTAATGRACTSQETPRSLDDIPRCGYQAPGPATPAPHNAPDLSVGYREQYNYDPVGNLVLLDYRTSDKQQHWTRRYAYGLPGQPVANNQLTALDSGSTTATYHYDPNGNLTTQNHERQHAWDHANRMTGYTVQAGQTPTLEARYLYAADGTRVKKWVRKNGSTTESTTYLDETLDLRDWTAQGTRRHNGTIHLHNKTSRLATVRYGSAHHDDPSPTRQYHLGDHLGSSHLTLDDTGIFLNREEYYPYGETSFGSYAKKRYRYIGAERDEETGLYYMSARYYAPWLARWMSCDPSLSDKAQSLYAYVRNNPLAFSDPTGRQEQAGPPSAQTVPDPVLRHQPTFLFGEFGTRGEEWMREQNWRYYDEGERAKSLMISPTMSEGIKHRLNQLDAAAGLFIGAMAYTFERPGAFLSLGLEKFTGVVGQQNVDALASVPEPDLRLAGAALKGVIAWKAVGLAVMADRAKVLALGTQLDFASPRLPNFAMDAIGEQSKLTSAYSRPSQAVLATAEARAAPTVGSALKADPIHRTAVFLLPEAAEKGAVFRVVGGDKVERTLIQMPQRGEKGELGIVEWLMGPKGLEHQRWKAGFGGWGRPN